jgi:hypothetical protein
MFSRTYAHSTSQVLLAVFRTVIFYMAWQWSAAKILQLSECLPWYQSEMETHQACLAVLMIEGPAGSPQILVVRCFLLFTRIFSFEIYKYREVI